MNVHFRLVRGISQLREWLIDEGWRLAVDGPTLLTASHPEVRDQRAARTRLLEMGLLTSSRLRIEFVQSRMHHNQDDDAIPLLVAPRYPSSSERGPTPS
jgi:hypothetical protein